MIVVIYDSGQRMVLEIPDDDKRDLHVIWDEYKKKMANKEEKQLWLPSEGQS
jgi:hypothetical protein